MTPDTPDKVDETLHCHPYMCFIHTNEPLFGARNNSCADRETVSHQNHSKGLIEVPFSNTTPYCLLTNDVAIIQVCDTTTCNRHIISHNITILKYFYDESENKM